MRAYAPNGSSYIWKSIVKTVNEPKEGFIIRIGKGKVSFWFDRWLWQAHLSDLVNYVNIQDSHLMVHYVFNDVNWNFSMLAEDCKECMRNILVNDSLDDEVPPLESILSGLLITSDTRTDSWPWLWSFSLPTVASSS